MTVMQTRDDVEGFHNSEMYVTEFTQIIVAALINFFLQKCRAYLRAELNTIVTPPSTVFTQMSTAALINPPPNAALIRVITVIGNLRVYYI